MYLVNNVLENQIWTVPLLSVFISYLLLVIVYSMFASKKIDKSKM